MMVIMKSNARIRKRERIYCRYNKKYILTSEQTVITVICLTLSILNRHLNRKSTVNTAIIYQKTNLARYPILFHSHQFGKQALKLVSITVESKNMS